MDEGDMAATKKAPKKSENKEEEEQEGPSLIDLAYEVHELKEMLHHIAHEQQYQNMEMLPKAAVELHATGSSISSVAVIVEGQKLNSAVKAVPKVMEAFYQKKKKYEDGHNPSYA